MSHVSHMSQRELRPSPPIVFSHFKKGILHVTRVSHVTKRVAHSTDTTEFGSRELANSHSTVRSLPVYLFRNSEK